MQTSINKEILDKESTLVVDNLVKMEGYVYANASLSQVAMEECPQDKKLLSKIDECFDIIQSRIDSIESSIEDTIEKSSFKDELIKELQSFVEDSETYSFKSTCKGGLLGKYL